MRKLIFYMRIILTALMFIVININVVLGLETSNLAFKELQLSFWLEYDQQRDWPRGVPSALTSYNGKFVNNGSTPYQGRVEFRIPKDQTIINMACETEQGMVCLPYDVVEDKDFKILSWQPSKPINPGVEYPFMLEFYSNPIQGNTNKSADLLYNSIYQAEKLNIDIKQPLKATNFQTIPVQQRKELDSQGFTNYYYQYSNVLSNNQIKIQAKYLKADNEPSVVPNNIDNQGLVQTNSKAIINDSTSSVVIMSAILLIGGIFYYRLISSKAIQAKKLKYRTKRIIKTKKMDETDEP